MIHNYLVHGFCEAVHLQKATQRESVEMAGKKVKAQIITGIIKQLGVSDVTRHSLLGNVFFFKISSEKDLWVTFIKPLKYSTIYSSFS